MVAAAAIGGEALAGTVGADALGAVAFDGLAGEAVGGLAADAAGSFAGDAAMGGFAGGDGAFSSAMGGLGGDAGGFAGSDGAFYSAMGDGGGFGGSYGGAGYAGSDGAFNSAMGAGSDGGAGGFSFGKMANGAGTLLSGMISGNAAQRAAQIQAQAGQQTIAMRQGMFDKSQANLAPYMQGGSSALSSLSGKFADGSLGGNFTGADYLANKDPGYEFQLNQGNQALQNSQAAHDGVMSGSAMKGLIDYNQGMASTGYQNAYNRWLSSQQNTYGQLAGVSAMGANAATGAATNANDFSKSIGGSMQNVGNVRGSGVVGQANNYGQAIGGIGGQMYSLRDMAGQGGGATDFYGQNNPMNQSNQSA